MSRPELDERAPPVSGTAPGPTSSPGRPERPRLVVALSGRFAHPRQREWWGYGIWGAALVLMLIPEISAAANLGVPWPTISGTVGHLENEHSWIALIVVALIVGFAYQWLRYPAYPGRPVAHAPSRLRGRSYLGRLTYRCTRLSPDDRNEIPVWLLGVGIVAVGAASYVAAAQDADRFGLAYVLYGTFALFFVVVPSLIAFLWPTEVPYPTFFRSLANLDHRFHLIAVLVVIGFVILLLHLALYPWPGIFHQLQKATPSSL